MNLIDQRKIDQLRSLIGTEIQIAEFDIPLEFQLERKSIHCWRFAIKNRIGFVEFSSDWLGDTEEGGIDIHKLEVEFLAAPSFLNTSTLAHSKTGQSLPGIEMGCKVRLFTEPGKISKITICDLDVLEGDEHVHFDTAIVFNTSSGVLSLRTIDSIQGGFIVDVLETGRQTQLHELAKVRVEIT